MARTKDKVLIKRKMFGRIALVTTGSAIPTDRVSLSRYDSIASPYIWISIVMNGVRIQPYVNDVYTTMFFLGEPDKKDNLQFL